MSLKHSLTKGKLSVGTWITLAHPAIAEIFARAGFDFLVVDMEHSSLTVRDAEDLIRVAAMAQTPALVRLTSNDPDLAKRMMDSGATGIIVPMVNSEADARRAVRSVYYPPKGTRGVGLARAQGYGSDFKGYWQRSTEETVVIVQIEHVEAVKNISEILSVEGVDGYILGPYDLSASAGIAGQFSEPSFKQMVEKVREAGVALGKPGGMHLVEPDLAQLRDLISQDFRFMAYSLDIRMLDHAARAARQVIKEYAEVKS